jgi:hypothetical protein
MAGIVGAIAFPSAREGLTGTGARPDGSVVRPAGESEGVAPSPDAGEEVTLSVGHKVGCLDISDGPFVHVSRRDLIGLDELAQPGRRERVDLVVIGAIYCHLTFLKIIKIIIYMTSLLPGQVVRYSQPAPGESAFWFVVVEAHDGRALIRLLNPETWGFAPALAPVELVAASEVCEAL